MLGDVGRCWEMLGDVGRCASGLDAAESASRGWKQRTEPKRQTLVACFNMFQHVSTLSLKLTYIYLKNHKYILNTCLNIF